MRGEISGLGSPLKSALWKHAGNMGEGIDGIHALEALGEAFLRNMNHRALGVTLWRGDAAMLQSKASFLSHLPVIAQLKSGEAIETMKKATSIDRNDQEAQRRSRSCRGGGQ